MTKHKKPFKPIALFHNRQMLQYMAQKDLQQKALQAIQDVLPEALALQTIDCVLRERRLIIYTHSATWASQLRFYSREIQAAVSSEIKRPIDKVQLRILHRNRPKAIANSHANIPSLENIECIQSNALSCTDKKLKTALLKLSHTLRGGFEHS